MSNSLSTRLETRTKEYKKKAKLKVLEKLKIKLKEMEEKGFTSPHLQGFDSSIENQYHFIVFFI